MSLLTRKQIECRINNGQLIRNPRFRSDGQFDIEADSYDLEAGTAIWKQITEGGESGRVDTQAYEQGRSAANQRTVTVNPGQMIFVVTREDVLMPPDLTGTVYSRNNLALKGILALNAGHVDSGYEGPIAIRLINLRAVPWTLTLGEPIFTITFQTVDANQDGLSSDNRRISQEEMISRVRETANAALSNALYDLYRTDVDKRLNEFRTSMLDEFRKERDERWVRREQLWSVLLNSIGKKILAVAIIVATLAGGVASIIYVTRLILENFADKMP